jgi:hypothetical protein
MKLDIDFSQHSAFSEFINSGTSGASEYSQIMAEIDQTTTEIYATNSGWKAVAERWAQFDECAQRLRTYPCA